MYEFIRYMNSCMLWLFFVNSYILYEFIDLIYSHIFFWILFSSPTTAMFDDNDDYVNPISGFGFVVYLL
jgi:hypothetical protein